jgi:hypothetical protein
MGQIITWQRLAGMFSRSVSGKREIGQLEFAFTGLLTQELTGATGNGRA